MSVCLSVRSHNSKITRPNFTEFLCTLSIALARSFSGGVAIRDVLPVLWMTSYCIPWGSGSLRIKHDVMFRRVRQVVVPIGRRDNYRSLVELIRMGCR